MAFSHPTADQILALKINAGIDDLASHELFEGATPDVVQAVVEGIARFAESEWAPLDRLGDTQGAYCANGTVTLPKGYKEAYASYAGQGWNAIAAPTEFGGQGLPFSLSACVLENLGTANFGFSLLPLLSMGAAEAISHHASPDQKATYLPKLLSGEWSGTMNLTEPQAGSDLGALRTTATPIESGEHAGKYKISGTKIFITFGEHDLAENIIQLVLARTPDAPAGSRGISMFIVPKFLPDADGNHTVRNDYRAVSIEHKMGIHISPTCVMSYGDNDNCIGELVGQENAGLRYMFTMMNNARVNVGNQGVQIAKRATRQAIAFAQDRVQSARAGAANRDPVAIIEHPDVRRMILRMRALTEAARALLYYTTGQLDRGSTGDEAAQDAG